MTDDTRATGDEILLLDDGVWGRALQRLVLVGDAEALRTFGCCTLTLVVDDVIDHDILSARYTSVEVVLACPPQQAAIIDDPDHPVAAAIQDAVRQALPPNTIPRRFAVIETTATQPSQDDGVRILVSAMDGDRGNQGPRGLVAPELTWRHLRFRSRTEIRVAEALDRKGVLYFPNCRGRLGKPNDRINREPDFLVCCRGAWGILEVDGKSYHLDAERDAERDSLFHSAGIAVIKRYDAKECYEHADDVVAEFLACLTGGAEQWKGEDQEMSLLSVQSGAVHRLD